MRVHIFFVVVGELWTVWLIGFHYHITYCQTIMVEKWKLMVIYEGETETRNRNLFFRLDKSERLNCILSCMEEKGSRIDVKITYSVEDFMQNRLNQDSRWQLPSISCLKYFNSMTLLHTSFLKIKSTLCHKFCTEPNPV
jgi:hypothetical protein